MSYNVTIEKKPGSLVVITGELPYEVLEAHRAAAVKHLAADVEIAGFRKGHVPENILVSKIGEMPLITEMAEHALSEAYPQIVAEHKLDVIGYPQIGITKIAKGNPLGFTITVAVVPLMELPDYFALAKKANAEKESKEVTDEEVTNQINDILRQKAAYERLQTKAQHNHEHDHSDPNHTHDDEPIEDIKDLPLPELTDEYVKGLGQFENVADFKTKIREHLTIQKSQDVDSRHRAKITDAIIADTKVDLPQVMVDAEINQMFAQMESDLERAQLKLDDYLTHIKKTKEDLKKEWVPGAEKRAKLQLVLNEIAKREKIEADPSLVDAQTDALRAQYKDADEKRVRVYVTSVLTNEAVLKKLEETT